MITCVLVVRRCRRGELGLELAVCLALQAFWEPLLSDRATRNPEAEAAHSWLDEVRTAFGFGNERIPANFGRV